MHKISTTLTIFILAAGLTGCGENDTASTPAKQSTVNQVAKTQSTQSPAGTETTTKAPVDTASTSDTSLPAESATDIRISETPKAETTETEITDSEQLVDEASSVAASDKPYQLINGVISENAIEGWKTYNGGGCGACHGKGGIGAVGPNLAVSVTQKLSKEDFKNIVTNGVSGTMMRPHNTNKRVMDNLDNLYAYLMARGDDVLGPGNLIKLPLGK